jgi:hypothetical protein
MPRKRVVAVIGSGSESHLRAVSDARALGTLIAQRGWVLMTGGRNAGVMAAATNAAHEAGGLTVGILPKAYPDGELPIGLDVAIVTDMRNGRNNVIGLSADVVVACGVDGAGTASEVALALKNGKTVILLNASDDARRFFAGLGDGRVLPVDSAHAAIAVIDERNLCAAGRTP